MYNLSHEARKALNVCQARRALLQHLQLAIALQWTLFKRWLPLP